MAANGKISIDPLTRIEGHLAVNVDVTDHKVTDAWCGGEMYRGFEEILKGRHPMDAQQITQRICGVCPVSHGTASVMAQDQAYGVTVPDNGRLMRNLLLGANYLQSHIAHFYVLAALDFIDITAVLKYKGKDPTMNLLKDWVQSQVSSNASLPAAPFLPRYEGKYVTDLNANLSAIGHYAQGLDMRAMAHEMGALWGGKLPHATALVPGGMTGHCDAKSIAAYATMLEQVAGFVAGPMVEDLLAVAAAFPDYFKIGPGCGNFLAYGVFPESSTAGSEYFPAGVMFGGVDASPQALNVDSISESVRYSKFIGTGSLAPFNGQTRPDPKKAGAYSWLKAPRYQGKPMEVGPNARMLVAYHRGVPLVKQVIDGFLAKTKLPLAAMDSVLGRYVLRVLECDVVARLCRKWINALEPGKKTFEPYDIPAAGRGIGLTEAPRGALGHWITIKDHKIDLYQCVVPTTWNCSPRDDSGVLGPMEQSLLNTPIADASQPLEAARVVRSFDPCLACAVH